MTKGEFRLGMMLFVISIQLSVITVCLGVIISKL